MPNLQLYPKEQPWLVAGFDSGLHCHVSQILLKEIDIKLGDINDS